jgi:acylphosphatase
MIAKATIIIKGDVQETGYRGLVFETARKLKLSGYVENLEDGRVRVVCEGEKKAIEELCKEIRIKDDFVVVESIRKRFSKPTGEFKKFVVKTEDLTFEMFQGYATAGKYFRSVGEKVDGVGNKVDSVGEKVGGVGSKVDSVGTEVRGVRSEVKAVGKSIDSMHKSMDQKFDRMDDSYGEFVQKMDSLDNHLREIRDDFKLLVNHVVKGDKEIFRSQ